MMNSKNTFKTLYIITTLFVSSLGLCQIKQINTGTSAYLYDLSVINQNIVINGNNDYLVKSIDECNTLSPLAIPGPTGYITRLQRLDLNTVFLLSYTPSQTLLHKSTDGGNNWIQKSTTSGAFSHDFRFFDSTEALMTDGPYLWRTTNGGASWTNNNSPFSIENTAIKTYGDSMVCVAGVNVLLGGIMLSKDRGHTWPYGWGFGKNPTDIFFLNKDTIFGVSKAGGFTKTTNGGLTWDNSSEPPINNCYGIYFKNGKEGYLVGADIDGNALVVKTTDLGKTWSSFNINIKSTLTKMAVLNDSIAILIGSSGVLLRWNYSNTIFTGIVENYLNSIALTVFPNPVKNKLNFESNNTSFENLKINMSNTFGQTVYSKDVFDLKEELDINFLESGIYYLKLESEKGYKVFKIVKE